MSLKVFCCVALLASGSVFCNALAQVDGDIDAQRLLKLNLSDWYFARYELGYEHNVFENYDTQIQEFSAKLPTSQSEQGLRHRDAQHSYRESPNKCSVHTQ